ncbi:MAG TPA: SRPBCC family protein [Pelobium sp.]
MNTNKATIISGSRIINTPVENAYKKLIEPTEQVKWNTLYLDAKTEPAGEITNGTIMTGNFKGSGKAIVEFQNVQPNREFTHYSKMKMFNLISLGEFYHTYKVVDKNGQTEFTQTVSYEPKSLGKLLKNIIVKSFKKRLPESFDEFQKYVEAN